MDVEPGRTFQTARPSFARRSDLPFSSKMSATNFSRRGHSGTKTWGGTARDCGSLR